MFREYLNEIKTKAKAVHSSKPLWNGEDYLEDKTIIIPNKKDIPVVFPESIPYHFDCSGGDLTSLEGCPKIIEGSFSCSYNSNLTSLEGAPENIRGSFFCNYINLKNLDYFPKQVGKNVSLLHKHSGVAFTIQDILSVCKVGGSIDV